MKAKEARPIFRVLAGVLAILLLWFSLGVAYSKFISGSSEDLNLEGLNLILVLIALVSGVVLAYVAIAGYGPKLNAKITLFNIKIPKMFGISIFVFLVLLYLVVDRAIFLSKSEWTLGTVYKIFVETGKCESWSRRGRYDCTEYTAAVNFYVESEPYTLIVSAGETEGIKPRSHANYRVGNPVPIVYNRDHPNESYRDHIWDIWGTPILVFFALLFTLFLGFRKGSSKEPETPDKDIQK